MQLDTLTQQVFIFVFAHEDHSLVPLLSVLLIMSVMMILRISSSNRRVISSSAKDKLQNFLLNYFDKDEVDYALRFYIPVQYKRIIPSQPVINTNGEIPNTLIPYLVSDGLTTDNPVKHFFILANAGVGKTTFLINLFAACNQESTYKNRLHIVPLRHADAFDIVKNIPNPESTILLLDGFNEDAKAVVNYQKRLEQLLKISSSFQKVVVTCRGFFFSTELNSSFLSYLMREKENMEQKGIACFNLTYFDLEQIQKYIKKKYTLWDYKKRKSALNMVQQTPHLMRQPLLLSYAETLLESQKTNYSYSYQIYEDLILTWIERASLSKRPEERENFKLRVFQLMKSIALHLYGKHTRGEAPFMKEFDAMNLVYNHDLYPEDLTADSRSVISHHIDQGYRFSHSSIMEYFVAKEASQNTEFLRNLSFAGMDQAQKFLQEIIMNEDCTEVKGIRLTVEDQGRIITLPMKNFYIGKHPITVRQYRVYCEASKEKMPDEPEWGWNDEDPMVGISWVEARQYCKWYSNLTGLRFDLPHEREWEYAAAGGHRSKRYAYAGGRNIDKVAWYKKNSGRRTQAVGQKQPNSLGIYDMSGLVWEWCSNWFEQYTALDFSLNPETTRGKAIRGGSWLQHDSSCKISTRGWRKPETQSHTIGFRLKLSPRTTF